MLQLSKGSSVLSPTIADTYVTTLTATSGGFLSSGNSPRDSLGSDASSSRSRGSYGA